MFFEKKVIADLCTKYGLQLNCPSTISGSQLLWAISGNESSFGENCAPKHEDGYCYGHKYFEPSTWGCLSHCSFGPWQVMYTHSKQFTPMELINDPEKCIQVAINFINTEILGRQMASTLSEIGDAYNSGSFKDNNVPVLYISKLTNNYGIQMPSLG